jgi:hypothetical protein
MAMGGGGYKLLRNFRAYGMLREIYSDTGRAGSPFRPETAQKGLI